MLKDGNHAGLLMLKYAVSPRMQIGVEEIKDAGICSPKCNMQNIVVGR